MDAGESRSRGRHQRLSTVVPATPPYAGRMSALKVLFIGGSGIISSACSRLAVERGIDLYVLNRGAARGPPAARGGARCCAATSATRRRCATRSAVTRVRRGRRLGRVHARARAGRHRPVPRAAPASTCSSARRRRTRRRRRGCRSSESTPLRNPFWQYSRDKIACEDLLVRAYRDEGFPATIVRPSHTYDRTLVPFDGGWTVVGADAPGQGDRRARRRHLAVDADPPRRLRPRLRRRCSAIRAPIGEAFHITSDDVADLEPDRRSASPRRPASRRGIVHVPSDAIAAADPEWGAGLLGDKAHSMVFDNTKLRRRGPGLRRHASRSSRAPARSSPGTTRTRPARWSTRGSTR